MDIFKLAANPKFIPGIYNYCDRWCERCFLTSRCMTYAIDAEDNNDPSARDLNNKVFWERLHAIFRQTAKMLNELASEMGVDLTSLDKESLSESVSYQIDDADNHELIRASHQYIQMRLFRQKVYLSMKNFLARLIALMACFASSNVAPSPG